MPTRPCLGCGRLTTRAGSRCEDCSSKRNRARDAQRGNRHERGYDALHDRIRADLLAKLVPGTACPRCGQPMWPTQELHAGHPIGRGLRIDPNSRADHLEHASCNEGAKD
jgi:hypothetical protein